MQKHQRLLQDFAFSVVILAVLTIAGILVMGQAIRPVFDVPAPKIAQRAPKAVSARQRASFRDRSPNDAVPSPAPRHEEEAPAASSAPAAPALTAAETGARDEKLKAAMRLVDEGNWQDAEKVLKELVAQFPDYEMALSELAMIHYIDKRDPAGAIPYMERVLKVNPANASMVNELIAAYQETGRPDDALATLQRMSQEGQTSPAVESGMARLLRDQGRYDESVQHLQKGLAGVKPGEPVGGILEEMGDTFQNMGDGDKAIEAYYRALAEESGRQKNANDPLAMERSFDIKLKVARAFLKDGRTEEAQHMLAELEADSPGDARLAELRQELGGRAARL